ncbi:MAG: DUF5057 domain-containing protein [Agathobacter sp.]
MTQKDKLGHMLKSSYKQILAAILVISLVLVMIPITQKQSGAVVYGYDTSKDIIRGVVDHISQLPQYGKEVSASLRGTKAQPFFILEVVPYEEEAEFGYLVDGCEPIDVDAVSKDDIKGIISSISQAASFNENGGSIYYFGDDESASYYNESNTVSITKITRDYSQNGYLKYVGPGNGNWEITLNLGGTYDAAPAGTGSFVWHKGNPYITGEDSNKIYSISNYPYVTLQDGVCFNDVPREASESDPAYCAVVSYYISNEVFLTKTLGLSVEEASNFSVLVKTISADELSANPEWIDYADLINVSCKSHVGNLPGIYKQYNRLHHTDFSSGSGYDKNGFIAEDISWEAALRMYNKVTADENYAGLILDDVVYNTGSWNVNESDVNKIKKSITLDVYDLRGDKLTTTGSFDGYNNNMYKLAIMLMSMDKDLFKLMYLTPQDETNPASTVIRDGKNTRQKNDAQTYWCPQTFLFVPDNTYPYYNYWNGSAEAWESYHMDQTITTRKSLVIDHVYTYQGYSAIGQCYLNRMYYNESDLQKYNDFYTYCKENGLSLDQINPSIAVRFILGNSNKEEFTLGTLNVLDIEPCVALDSNNQPDWQVDEAYIRKLIPSFKGTIHVVHQTTAEFNGKIEDLNSTYQMIFMGTDCGAYNLTTINYNDISVKVPKWNDSSLGNRIYLHTGDLMYATQVEYLHSGTSYRSRSVKFLNSINYSSVSAKTAAEVRFLGNDITSNKKQDLENYLKSGYPIVTASYLYDLNTTFIDPNCYVYKLVNENKSVENTTLLKFTDLQNIKKLLTSKSDKVVFTNTPKLYNGNTISDTSAKLANPNYLNPDGGVASLDFSFTVSEPGYAYRIYVDQDRDSKFSSDEVVYEANAAQGTNGYSYRIASVMYGSVMWKIEVYNTSNEQIRYQTSGCSAVKRRNSVAKKTVNVLQIMPKNTTGNGYLNLQESDLFKKYYNGLEDYNVTVTSISWNDFENLFSKDAGKRYSYRIDADGKGIETNADKIKPLKVNGMDVSLDTFNMLIIGFSDTYGAQDVSNQYGAVHWLQHYADSGKSILFTHDTTSLYNLQYSNSPSGTPIIFGSTLNAMMRDRLGMNTYGMISNQLGSSGEIDSARNYQTKVYGGAYTSINSQAIHGFTYSSIQRLGDLMSSKSNRKNANTYTRDYGYKMIYNKIPDFKDSTDRTTTATQINQGQITTYPYYISDESANRDITVAKTHAQWYTLNLEDEDVTVWYTLGMGDGTNGLTYAVSPQDAANNYYIYSKGNIFYSGVGDTTVSNDVEAKLFVNTMVAAYQASMEPPVVEILNDEAVSILPMNYTIEIPQEINVVEGVEEAEELTGSYEVEFAPFEMNLVSTTMTMTIQIGDSYVDEIYLDGTKITANAAHQFVGIQNGRSYILKYDLSNINNADDSFRNIKFEISNNKVEGTNTTNLTMGIQPLFALD